MPVHLLLLQVTHSYVYQRDDDQDLQPKNRRIEERVERAREDAFAPAEALARARCKGLIGAMGVCGEGREENAIY